MFKKYHQVISLLLIATAVVYSFYSIKPSEKIEQTTDLSQFSYENALNHLYNITKSAHFPGVEDHSNVRNYLVSEFEKLGLQVEVQEQMAVNKKWRAAVNTKNIIAKIKGTEPGKALLLLSHYDSNPHSSLGASDAGSGVVAILEGVRAFLEKKTPPKNDIIICITDAEELGLLGAKAFVEHHSWVKNIGLVLNFEARGSGGPSYMLMETNGGNKNLIKAFQEAEVNQPVANSLMYSIYKMLPNDTDLTVFRENGDIDGFNFAFIGDHFDYHTAQDSYERMDISSLKHQVDYLTNCLNYFSNSSLENLKTTEDYVFFNFPVVGMVYYPFTWVKTLFVISIIWFIAILFIGFSKRKLILRSVLKGFVPLLLSLTVTSLLAFYGWRFLLQIHPGYKDVLHGFTYNGYYYIASFVALTLAVTFWFYKGFFKKRTAKDLLIAPIFLWLVINEFVTFNLSGAGFFIIPVFLMLGMLTWFIFSKKEIKGNYIPTILGIPILIIFAPFVKMFPVGLGLKMLVVSSVFTVLLFVIFIPVFSQYTKYKKLVKLFTLIGLMVLISASIYSGFNKERKQPNSLIYVLNSDKNEAYWASYNYNLDDFTKQVLGDNPEQGSYDSSVTTSKYKTKIKWYKNAEVKAFEKPQIQIISDTVFNEERKICLSISSLRNANRIDIMAKNSIKFKEFKVNDEALKVKKNKYVLEVENESLMTYYISEENEIIDLEFVVSKNQKFDLDVLEAKYDLYTNSNFNIIPRSDEMMPMPFVLNDATVIKTNVKF